MVTSRISILLLYAIVGVHGIIYTPVVKTASGEVRGQLVTLPTGQVVKKYLGIPFATAERFHPPQHPAPWTGVKVVVTAGKICPQAVFSMFGILAKDMSEDCLNLNVFVPNNTQSSSALPVMVWVHGGGYVGGTNRIYDGSFISALGDVIVVVINYRLGVLGFLSTGKNRLKGNYGMLDQVEGLKWVNKNIQRFGGNPEKVTIFGESAGGTSVGLLMLSPLASGLYQNVILQSGAGAAFWAASYYSEAEQAARSFGKFIGCNSIEEIANCLKSKSLTAIVTAGNRIPEAGHARLTPVIDGHFLTEDPLFILKGGKFNKSNIMIGVTNDEGALLTSNVPGISYGIVNASQGIKRAVFEAVTKKLSLARNQNPPLMDAIIYRYTDWSNVSDPVRNRRMFIDMISDDLFAAPAILSANAFAKKTDNPTFFYHWEHRIVQPLPGVPQVASWVRAYHGADIFLVFGFPLNFANSHSIDGNFSREIIKRWTNFAKTGNPNKPASVSMPWPQYTLTTQQYMTLRPTLEVGSKLRPDYMAFWNVFVPQAISSMPTPLTCGPPVNTAQVSTQAGYLQVGFILFLSSIGTRIF